MITHTETRVLPYSAEAIFNVVADVQDYSKFLPWCVASRVKSRKNNVLDADVVIGYGPFREAFQCKVHLTPYSNIEVDYVKGPLDRLQNTWEFEALSLESTRVNFHVSLAFKSMLLDKMVRAVFDTACSKIIEAFELRLVKITD